MVGRGPNGVTFNSRAVCSGSARGAEVTLFVTEPLYRSHPEGLFPQVANALWGAAG